MRAVGSRRQTDRGHVQATADRRETAGWAMVSEALPQHTQSAPIRATVAHSSDENALDWVARDLCG